MTLTRRTLAAAGLTVPVLASSPARGRTRPIVIAHRGASGERPEHTLMAYRLAIAQGADFIEPDLVVSKDGHLVVRHENEIGGTTDVASRTAFANRRTTRLIDGQRITGWFTEDFTLAELKTLRARERLPQLRRGSARFDRREPIVTFQEVLDLAKAESRRIGRVIGIYPEMKHPTYFAGLGLPLEGRLAQALKRNGLDSPTAPVFVQCFEVEPLKAFRKLSKARRVLLVGRGPALVDVTTPEGLKAVAAFAEAIGPEWPLILTAEDSAPPKGVLRASRLVQDAHAAGLVVHPWTVRAENTFLPRFLHNGVAPGEHGGVGVLFAALYATGVDGVFSDFPGMAVQARNAFFRARARP